MLTEILTENCYEEVIIFRKPINNTKTWSFELGVEKEKSHQSGDI